MRHQLELHSNFGFLLQFLLSPFHYNNAGSKLDHPALDVLRTSPYATCYTHSWMPCLSTGWRLVRVHRRAVQLATCTMLHAMPTLQVDAPYFGMPARGCNSSTPKLRKCQNASPHPVSWRDDSSSGCTVELCNMLHAPHYMLHPLCRWMPQILGWRLAGCAAKLCKCNTHQALPCKCNRQLATCFAHSTSGCPVFRQDDGSRAAPSSHADAICNSLCALPTP